jgi:hypothetical protein
MKAYPLLHIILSSFHVIMTFQDTDFSFSSFPLVQNGTGKTVHALHCSGATAWWWWWWWWGCDMQLL